MEEILQQIIYGLSEVYGDEKFTEKRIGGTNNNYALPTRLFQVKGCFEYSKEIKALGKEDQEKFKQYDIGNFMSEELQISELIAKAYYQTGSKRLETKKLIAEMKKTNPFVEGNIFKSVENVSLKTIIAYKDDSGKHSFLDDY
jgi:hypothetical protein